MDNKELNEDLEFIEDLELATDLGFIEDLDEEDEAEEQRRLQRKKRIEEMKRRKHQAELIQRCVVAVAAVLLLFVGFGIGALISIRMERQSGEAHPESLSDEASTDRDENLPSTAGANWGQVASGLGSFLGGDFRDMLDTGGSVGDLPEDTDEPAADADQTEEEYASAGDGENTPQEPVFTAHATAATSSFRREIISKFGVLIDVEAETILAGKEFSSRMNPASMTKILTVFTAAEALGIMDGTEAVLDDTFTMTMEINNYCVENDCSIAGFLEGEEITVRDLFYGTVLPSGADGAVGLAEYVAGSHEAFVEMMNEKLEKLGLSESTHFTNCVGLYDESHYSTAYDIAVILKETADNPFCRELLSTRTYHTSPTEQNPEGFSLSNLLLTRFDERDTHGDVLCGKTGFVNESGYCAATLSVDMSGREYLCVTALSSSSMQCVEDQTMLYQEFLSAE